MLKIRFYPLVMLLTGCTVGKQITMSQPKGWAVSLSQTWDVLGPFPLQAREQQFISPSYPVDLSKSIDYSREWPSSYADNGVVSWSTVESESNGDLKVSYPNVRWNDLRATEGWAALQHHSVVRTILTVSPPKEGGISTKPPRVAIKLSQGSYFAIAPTIFLSSAPKFVPEWHAGNIYALDPALPAIVSLPELPSLTTDTEYQLFISGDYEVRLFGDPHSLEPPSETPVAHFDIQIEALLPSLDVVYEAQQDVTCDFVDGFAFGDALGVGIHSLSGWWTASDVKITDGTRGLTVSLVEKTRISPTQTRVVPLKLTQSSQFYGETITLELTFTSRDSHAETKTLPVVLSVKQLPSWTTTDYSHIKTSYFFAETSPSSFLVLPPKEKNVVDEIPKEPIVALHGAGVDILGEGEKFWATAIRRQQHSWVIMPTGRTSWGLDWHSSSTQDVWASVAALEIILSAEDSAWKAWKLAPSTRVVAMGHSNGGQGAWFLSSRYPDRVIALVAAAGYLKSQAYVSLTMSRSAHYIDPALKSILESSLTPDDNDLFMSNLVDTPVLAIHGGADENVPTWHSREAVSVLKQWGSTKATYHEDPGKLHWYDGVLDNDRVQAFLDDVFSNSQHPKPPRSFTLTSASSFDMASFKKWEIYSSTVPGRLARLKVNLVEDNIYLETVNVDHIVGHGHVAGKSPLFLNGKPVSSEGSSLLSLYTSEDTSSRPHKPNLGRIQAVLNSSGPLTLIVPDKEDSYEFGVALRLVHDLHLNHRIDAEIVHSKNALQRGLGRGNIVVLGNSSMPFLKNLMRERRTPFSLAEDGFSLEETTFTGDGLATLFLHPHPTNEAGNMLIMSARDAAGWERAVRLFPIRTGIPVPDYIVVGRESDDIGAAGVKAAGFWTSKWEFSAPASWIGR